MEFLSFLLISIFITKGEFMSENRNFTVLGENKIYRGYIKHHKDDDKVSTAGVSISDSEIIPHNQSVYLTDIVRYDELEPLKYAKKFYKKLREFNEQGELVKGIIQIGKETGIVPIFDSPNQDLLDIKKCLNE